MVRTFCTGWNPIVQRGTHAQDFRSERLSVGADGAGARRDRATRQFEPGDRKVDVHLNRLVPGGARGRVHRHTHSDNIYIVRRGEGVLTADGRSYTLRADQVVFIPAGMAHSLSNLSDNIFDIFEIYTPAGRQFDSIPANPPHGEEARLQGAGLKPPLQNARAVSNHGGGPRLPAHASRRIDSRLTPTVDALGMRRCKSSTSSHPNLP